MEKPQFVSKAERERLALERLNARAPKRPAPAQTVGFELLPEHIRLMQVPEKKQRRVGDKQFNFDWEAKDDTSQQQQYPIYGRRKIAGMDDDLNDKQDELYYDQIMKRGTTAQIAQLQSRRDAQKPLAPELPWSTKSLADMQERDWRIFKEDFEITTRGSNVPHPLRYWDESSLPRSILDVISKCGYKTPTPIQRSAVTVGLEGRDCIGIAETGTGKSLGFLLPLLVHVLAQPKITPDLAENGPYSLILTPTRELALQIQTEIEHYRKLGVNSVVIIGGHTIGDQQLLLSSAHHIIVATPGRLRDMLDRRMCVISQCSYVVMDECDRMCEMGFEEDLNYILDAIESSEDLKRQTMMFSATLPLQVDRLARKYLDKPITITIGHGTPVTIEQRIEMVQPAQKFAKLQQIIKQFDTQCIVFVNSRKECDIVAGLLGTSRCITLHGGKTQSQREDALRQFKEGRRDIMIATDVASRGVDVKGLGLVVNYDMAKSVEDYTHRIGRTGRAGDKGTAITFLTNDDAEIYYDLKQFLDKCGCKKLPRDFVHHELTKRRSGAVKKRYEEVIMNQ